MRIWVFLFVFSILSLTLTTASADDEDEKDDDENEWGEDSGSIAAWLMIADEGWFEDDSLTGYIPLVAMIYLTLSGILLWRKLPDDWVDRVLRKRARRVHVQRWITVLFVLGLLIHVV